VNLSEAAPVFPFYRSLRRTLLLLTLVPALCGLTACSRFRHQPAANFVYVTRKQDHLTDRVAAVSTRTATVTNGERLQVLQRGRAYLQVKTSQGAIGWIREKDTASAATAAAFDSLKQAHAGDSVIATAVVLDEVSMHITAGRDSEKLYLLEEGDKLKLLERATLPKVALPGAEASSAAPKKPTASTPDSSTTAAAPNLPSPVLPPPVMEDWWLVRDAQGRTGWVLARMMDVDSPDAITRYAENQRVVSAAVLTTVNDPGADAADKNIPVYVVAYAPYKAGLPYDFNQVRVFTWNKAKHRYETAYRESNIEGFLPFVTGTVDESAIAGTKLAASLGGAPLPTFSYKVVPADAVIAIDPVTGIPKPGALIEKDFRLEGTYVRRVLLPGQTNTMPQAHPEQDAVKKSAAKKRR
jgi:SH3-like domain-containing protein